MRRIAALERPVLCVDEIERLGTFLELELERMVPDEVSGDAVQAYLAG